MTDRCRHCGHRGGRHKRGCREWGGPSHRAAPKIKPGLTKNMECLLDHAQIALCLTEMQARGEVSEDAQGLWSLTSR